MVVAPAFKFTSHDLDASIEVAKAIEDNGGIASQDELAVWLGYKSKNNGAFLSRIASARAFGLLTGQAGALEPSLRARNILRPDFPATEQRARLEAFEDVPLYKAVLDHYHGETLPDAKGLRNALETRWQIHEDRSTGVLGRLLDSAEQAGLFAVSGGRTRMIRPSLGEAARRPAVSTGAAAATPTSTRHPTSHGVADARHHKVIDGVLDMLPPTDSDWPEPAMAQWLSFFESALRVVYRVPAPPTGSRSTGSRDE
ncbi:MULTISPECIES: hypothetical protein [unclassified Nocardioides]|uniref:hypothetical protein n=1 Tax=unclassified Nocardioides TaxID=2615069 RepID=UPI0036227D13